MLKKSLEDGEWRDDRVREIVRTKLAGWEVHSKRDPIGLL